MSLVKNALILALALTLFACQKPAEAPTGPAIRDTIAVKYISVPELQIHQLPNDDSEIISTWNVGESVSVLSEKGDWTEIRMTDGASGWVHSNNLADSRGEVASSQEEPKFLVPPEQVYSPTNIHGEIVLEASVNASGDVIGIKVVSNTTGSDELVEQNKQALEKAKFYPLLKNGAPVPFLYTHRVEY